VQTKPTRGLPSETPFSAYQPRSMARDTSLGTAQMAAPG
jgi:hypothetical protein